jgi:hypothetical protein
VFSPLSVLPCSRRKKGGERGVRMRRKEMDVVQKR